VFFLLKFLFRVVIMAPPTQLVNIFSPILKDPHSGRTTTSSVGGEVSSRSSISNMNNGNVT